MPSRATALVAMTMSVARMYGCTAPQVPARISSFAPSIASSSTTMAALGQPMPVVWTETRVPLYVPV